MAVWYWALWSAIVYSNWLFLFNFWESLYKLVEVVWITHVHGVVWIFLSEWDGRGLFTLWSWFHVPGIEQASPSSTDVQHTHTSGDTMPDALCRRGQCRQPPRQGSAAENPPISLQQPQPPGQACYFTPKDIPIALLFIITFHSTLAMENTVVRVIFAINKFSAMSLTDEN